MRTPRFIVWCLGLLLSINLPLPASGQQRDVAGSKDHPILSRMPDFFIASYEETEFDRVDFRTEGGKETGVEGHTFQIDYELQEGATSPSELQILRNIQNALLEVGGTLLFEAPPEEAWLKVQKPNAAVWVYVFAHCDGECYDLTVVEEQTMVQDVVADAETLAREIGTTGHASLYGIYFDFDKSDVKPESRPALQEVATLLREDPGLALFVVGHTDGTGEVEYNMELSRARAAAVVSFLQSELGVPSGRLEAFGVGPLAPVASNDSEEGRSLNRRVELVKQTR